MKKFLVFAAAVVLCGTMVFAQRPVQKQKTISNTQVSQQRQGRDNTGVRTTATPPSNKKGAAPQDSP